MLVAVLLATGVFGYYAYRASKNLVTVDVRNMEVKDLVKILERQTWEKIYLQGDIDGKVTLNVSDMPLANVLEIVADQTPTRFSAIYALYSSGKTLDYLKKALAGDDVQPPNAWTNMHRGRSMISDFMAMAQEQNDLITVKLDHKDLETAARTLSRYTRGQIVPENGSFTIVNLELAQATVPEAVDALAKQAHKDWAELYVLRGGGRDRGPRRDTADGERRDGGEGGDRRERWREGRGTNDFFARGGTNDWGTNGPPWERPEFREEMEKRFQEQLATMTPEERQRAEERRKQFEEMRNMTPEQRRDAFAKMASSPEFQQRANQRMMNSIKNSTPEQRAERDKRSQRWANGRGR